MSKPRQSIAVRNVTARLRGQSLPPFHVVFEKWEARFSDRDANGHRIHRVATVGVWINMEELRSLALRAVHNKSRKSKDGPLNVELHYVQEVKNV
jgi:hypothetical protein